MSGGSAPSRGAPSVLFVCVANAARSQMAEALARRRWGDAVRVQSAGSAPTRVHPEALAVLAEVGIDASRQRSKPIAAIDLAGVDVVIALCAEEACPVIPGGARRVSWAMPDPDAPAGSMSDAALRERFRQARDAIAARIDALAASLRDDPSSLASLEP